MSHTPERKQPKQTSNKRREGREAALQLLYSHETQPDLADHGLEDFWSMRNAEPAVRKHAEGLYRGYLANQAAIDDRLAAALVNFSLSRLAAVDRNILRIAIFEIFHDEKVPPVVSLNEAVDIAKRFGGEDSGGFINGVLDRLLKDVTRKLR